MFANFFDKGSWYGTIISTHGMLCDMQVIEYMLYTCISCTDPEEFLQVLLQQTLRSPPLLQLSSGQDAYLYQLFLEQDARITAAPTTQQLLGLSFLQAGLKLKQVSVSCLLFSSSFSASSFIFLLCFYFFIIFLLIYPLSFSFPFIFLLFFLHSFFFIVTIIIIIMEKCPSVVMIHNVLILYLCVSEQDVCCFHP